MSLGLYSGWLNRPSLRPPRVKKCSVGLFLPKSRLSRKIRLVNGESAGGVRVQKTQNAYRRLITVSKHLNLIRYARVRLSF
jgi:hypothetical protein